MFSFYIIHPLQSLKPSISFFLPQSVSLNLFKRSFCLVGVKNRSCVVLTWENATWLFHCHSVIQLEKHVSAERTTCCHLCHSQLESVSTRNRRALIVIAKGRGALYCSMCREAPRCQNVVYSQRKTTADLISLIHWLRAVISNTQAYVASWQLEVRCTQMVARNKPGEKKQNTDALEFSSQVQSIVSNNSGFSKLVHICVKRLQ